MTNLIYQNDSNFNADRRLQGRDWPSVAHTMIGLQRLNNLQFCIEEALRRRIPGDLIEAGVWRGGASIFMRAVLKAHRVTNRKVWVADSFQGLPPPKPDIYPCDKGDIHHTYKQLAISLEEVKLNFERYGLLDRQVAFLKGWFCDSLPFLPVRKWAVIRLDGDMYESTMDGLINLYPDLSRGGYIIIDDFGAIESCRRAVLDFRRIHRISEKIQPVDWTGVYWQRR